MNGLAITISKAVRAPSRHTERRPAQLSVSLRRFALVRKLSVPALMVPSEF
jgi:hypothetical protein